MATKKAKETEKIENTKNTKDAKKVKNVKKDNKKKEKKNTKKSEGNYFKQVNKELKQVKWPSKKEVVKYTISTIVFCLIICVFFILLNLLMVYIKGLFL